METFCISCKKYPINETSSARKTKQNIIMLLSNCAVCGKKKSTFIKKELHIFNNIPNDYVKMNKIINKFLMTGDKELQPNLKM